MSLSTFDYKSSLENYKYLKNVENRIAIAKIRTDSCKLAVVTGKWAKVPFEQTLCSLCDKQKIETAFHFMFECPYNKLLRETMFQNMGKENIYFDMKNIKNQLNSLFLNGSLKALNAFGQYLKTSIRTKRKSLTIQSCQWFFFNIQ